MGEPEVRHQQKSYGCEIVVLHREGSNKAQQSLGYLEKSEIFLVDNNTD